MNTQTLKLGTAAAERTLSIVNRAFRHIPQSKNDIVETSNSSKYVYTNIEKQRWELSWTVLPSDDADVEDSNTGRDNLKVEYDKNTPLSFIVYDDETPQGSTTYTVIFVYYDEVYMRPLFRDMKDCWRYNITMILEET